jgi:serine O-acetyltransferase
MFLYDPLTWQRLAHRLHRTGVPVLPKLISFWIRWAFAAWVPHTVEIGRGTRLGYGGLCVVIHSDSRIGERVEIDQGVTLGGNGREEGAPVIEDDVYIGCGASILGPVTVGRGAVVAAGAVVLKNVPSRCVAAGVPASVVREGINIKEFLFHRRHNPAYPDVLGTASPGPTREPSDA